MKREQFRFPVFRDRLRQLCGDRSNIEFAAFLGMSRQTIGFYLNGDRIPDALTLTEIAKKCGISADWLLGLSDVKEPDGTLQQVCRYTGLNANSVRFLHENIAYRDENGLYRGGFSEDDYKPKQFLDDFFRFSLAEEDAKYDCLMSVLVRFCHNVNIVAKLETMDFENDISQAEREKAIEKINREYGRLGIWADSASHIALGDANFALNTFGKYFAAILDRETFLRPARKE